MLINAWHTATEKQTLSNNTNVFKGYPGPSVQNKIGKDNQNHFFLIYKTTEDKNIKILQDKNQLSKAELKEL